MEVFERAQQLQTPSTRMAAVESFSKKASIAVMAIGCTVILGWIFDLQLLKSILPGTRDDESQYCDLLYFGRVFSVHPTAAARRIKGKKVSKNY
ncbi:hypothetical protein [Microcoleus vaginatus]|uniref:hypothetical protein n=1 Tax=Microcoleus vaginatus TaxID=119532 RepID=UPI00403F897B